MFFVSRKSMARTSEKIVENGFVQTPCRSQKSRCARPR
jgi:hypothetical protein